MTHIRDTHTDENGNTFHRWAITAANNTISELLVDINTNEISWIWTHNDHCGQGHATHLYQTATTEMTIYHAPETHRTPEGNRFATRVGGPTMPDCTTCCTNLNYLDDEQDM